MFGYAVAQGWIDTPPRYGRAMDAAPPGRRAIRPYTLDEARALVAAATDPQIKAMVLLALNCGYGANDCANLPRSAVNLDGALVVFPRVKTDIDRAAPLWPETVAALRAVMDARQGDDLVFRRRCGLPWVRLNRRGRRIVWIDSTIHHFKSLCAAAGVECRGIYGLRHLHRTIADECADANAACRLMGHRLPGMAQVYVDAIEHDRLKRITDHIRFRLWPTQSPS
jgi:integrase